MQSLGNQSYETYNYLHDLWQKAKNLRTENRSLFAKGCGWERSLFINLWDIWGDDKNIFSLGSGRSLYDFV